MKTNHQLRILTGLIYGVVLILSLSTSHLAFALVFLVLNALTLWEFLKICKFSVLWVKILITAIGIIPFILLFLYQDALFSPMFLGMMLSSVVFYLVLAYFLFKHKKIQFHQKSPLTSSILYISISFACLHFLVLDGSFLYNGKQVLGILVLLWANDSFAYLIGRKIGKTPFAPLISPKKTWEGFISGGFATILTAFICTYLFPDISTIKWMMTAAIIAVAGPVGDLVESAFKREASMKDSGSLLPGHGGFLDRLDSFIFSVPFITLLWYFW